MSLILTMNAGSSSLKASLYTQASESAPLLTAHVDRIGQAPILYAKWADGGTLKDATVQGVGDHEAAVQAILWLITSHSPDAQIDAVSHRVVHGGPDFSESVVVNDRVLGELSKLVPFAPLHQPHNITGIRAAITAFPEALQVACFDTAFHRGQPWVHDTFALPHKYYDAGIRRYGFHGLSYDFIASELASRFPDLAAGRVVVAHLGNGASMCGLRAGSSVSSTMGFTALDGLPMGTRTGQIDPGVVLYLMDQDGMDIAGVTDLLYRRSGLLGLSGVSNDMRALEASPDPRASQAIDYFVARVRRELSALAADLGGLDGLVFTGGIGENSTRIRERVCDGMEWLGLHLDKSANRAGQDDLATDESPVQILRLRTDEEHVLAREARSHLHG